MAAVSLDPVVHVDGAPPDQARVEQALERFRHHNMALPDLSITFVDDSSECRGHDGLFRQTETTPWPIVICSGAGYVVAHELAHAWVAAWLDEPDRADYVEYRGLRTWRSDDVPRMERGTEDAAFMIQQVVMIPGDPTTERWAERVAAVKYLFELADGGQHRL